MGSETTIKGNQGPLLKDEAQLHRLIAELQSLVEKQLEQHDYNSVGNYLRFFDSWRSSKETRPVLDFYRDYNPPITAEHHTCVGLGLDLVSQAKTLEEKYPGIKKAVFPASCEEDILVDNYVSSVQNLGKSEKEHVVAAIRFKVGARNGVVIMDTGYHIPRPVVVMEDGGAPETGWFRIEAMQTTEQWYKYEWHPSGDYILWRTKVVKGGKTIEEESLIYIGRVFRSTTDTTERRNLIYPLKSWLKRDRDGGIRAGFYFAIKALENASVTFLYTDNSGKQQSRKLAFSGFLNNNILPDQRAVVKECEAQLGISKLDLFIEQVIDSLSADLFLKGVLCLNDRVFDEISRDN